MSRQEVPPLRRDLFFLTLGSAWGTFIVLTAGPWPLLLISAGTMLGPTFMRYWLLRSGIAGQLGSQLPESSASPSSLPPAAPSGAEP